MQKALGFNLNGSILKLYDKYKHLFRFVIVGGINTGVDFFTFAVVYSFMGFDKFLCQVVGYSAGVINSFILNKLWTFENSRSKFGTGGQIIRFLAVNLISLGISLLGLMGINEYFGANIFVTKIAITGIAQAVNYTGYKLWVFGKR